MGEPDVEVFARRMSSRQLARWAAFERVWGPITVQERVDLAMAVGAWASLRAAGAQDISPLDFLPDYDTSAPPKAQSPEDMIAVFRGIAVPTEGEQ